MAPTAFLGEPAPGLAASALLGMVAVAVVAPVVIAPLVATVVCDDDQHQVSAAWHAAGVAAGPRLVGRALAAARASLGLVALGGVAGVLTGAGMAAQASHRSWWLEGAPGVGGVALGAGLLGLSWVLGLLVGAWAVTSVRAVTALLVSLIATGAVASLLYFVPGLRTVFWATPWAALWPFDPQSFDSVQFATTVPVAARVVSGAGWLAVLAAAAVGRRRRDPYPVPGEARRRRP
jgi:hypothetical protein